LDAVVKAVRSDGSTVFGLMDARRGECESVVMPSPLSKEDRDLLYKMHIDADNVSALYRADQIRETEGKERTWDPLIKEGVKNFRRMRDEFCSRHPDMFVYQVEDDGERITPKPCSTQIDQERKN
jgi:hypothetical protein